MLVASYPLLDLNTFHMDVKAQWFASFSSKTELRALLTDRRISEEPLLILGGGSNILFTEDFEGVVLKNNIKGIHIVEESNDSILVDVGAGENWHQFVLHAVDNGWAGIENLSLIPGSVGASPIQNIGAYGVEVKDVITSVEAVNVHTKESRQFSNAECLFGYRDSIFKREEKGKWIITKVRFALKKNAALNTTYGAIKDTLDKMGISVPSIKDVSQAVIAIRQSKLPDPAQIGNAGSFFKNPEISINQLHSLKENYPAIVSYPIDATKVKVPAGWLIETAGWKGKNFGSYGVHKDQALVLVNYGNADGNDIKQLAQSIKHSIWETFGIQLETEVNII
ncbi:MAG: murB [Chitinophagaceae bacterium]|nr:murB [Chitinophagaceae bacterium]